MSLADLPPELLASWPLAVKAALRACSSRLRADLPWTREEAHAIVEAFYATRKSELIHDIRVLFRTVGLRRGLVPCYPFMIKARCDCDERRALRHHEGRRGGHLPRELAWLRPTLGLQPSEKM